jgi:hypothetical protein
VLLASVFIIKPKLSLSLFKHYAMKIYVGVEENSTPSEPQYYLEMSEVTNFTA